jgi:hypothetical protein
VFVADLDRDGVADSVIIERFTDNSLTRTRIRIAGSIQALHVGSGDTFPEVLDTADLNGDGVLDLLVADIDESAVWSGVLLVGPSRLEFAGLDARIPSSTTSYLWEPTEGHGECQQAVLPRVIRTAGRPSMISVAVGEARTAADCMTPRRDTLVLRGDRLRPR